MAVVSSSYSHEILKQLLLFGYKPELFEKSLIQNFGDGHIVGSSYDFSNETVTVWIEQYSPEEKAFQEIPEKVKFPKSELIDYAIYVESYRALEFIKSNFERHTDYGEAQMFFTRILDCFLKVWDLDESLYAFKKTFLLYFSNIADESIKLYQNYLPDIGLIKEVSRKIDLLRRKENETGYKLHPSILHRKLELFMDHLVAKGFIDSIGQRNLMQFLDGSRPQRPIDWKKKPKYFVYFIKCLTSKNNGVPQYLISCPGQKWKYLYEIFTVKQNKLQDKFYEKNNKLGKKPAKKIDDIFAYLKK